MDGGSHIIALVILLALSAYFSASETAFTSFNKAKMKTDADEGTVKAGLALKLNENYEKLLTTVLIGNNIVNIVATSLSTLLFVKLIPKNGDLAVTVSTIVMTLSVLIFGEITPKTLAKRSPEKAAQNFAFSMDFLMKLLTPLSAVFNLWQKFILKITKSEGEASVTEEEIITYVEEAAIGGEIDEQESELIKNVIKFSDLDVNDILTPRVDVEAVDITWDRERIAEVFATTEFSRLPVFEENLDTVKGILYQKDFFNFPSTPISDMVKPVKFIFSSMKISRLLKLFQETKCHMVIVTDEYGGTEGIVTLEDVLESLVGEIYDEHDEVIEEIVDLGSGDYKALGSMSIDNFFEYFKLPAEPEDPDISTLSGFTAHKLEKIPDENDSFEYENLLITVTKTDSNRVIEVKIHINELTDTTEEATE